MDSILQSIEDWFRGLLVSGIMDNLSNTFESVNNQVGQIATEVGQTPANFSPAVYNMIRTLSENVIMPIAGLILTFIACYELIQLGAAQIPFSTQTWEPDIFESVAPSQSCQFSQSSGFPASVQMMTDPKGAPPPLPFGERPLNATCAAPRSMSLYEPAY